MSINFTKILPYILVIGMFFYLQHEKNQARQEVVSMVTAMNSVTEKKIDDMGRTYFQGQQVRGNEKIFLSLKSDDSSVRELQAEVKKLQNKLEDNGSVTQFTENTFIDTTLTVSKNQDGSIISADYSDDWVSVKNRIPTVELIQARTNINIKNKYTVSLIKDKGEYVANIRSENPWVHGVDSVRTFTKVEEKKHWSVGVGLGYNPIDGRILPTVGVQYKLFNLPF